MKKTTISLLITIIGSIIVASTNHSAYSKPIENSTPATIDQFLMPKSPETQNKKNKLKKRKKTPKKTILFRYANEELVDIINALAAQKCVNILLPQGADAIKNKVTFSVEEKVSLNEAWELLAIILDLAGYSRLAQENMFVIKKSTDTITREPCPLFIGTKPEDLPDTEQQIRYLYYLANIKITDSDNELTKLLTALLPKNSYKVDQTTNGIIFSTKANLIKSAMKIIAELDKTGFAEKLIIMNLRYSSADMVAKLFNENILKAATGYNRYRLDTKKQAETSFFSKNTRVISAQQHLGLNALIILGRNQAVDRAKDFIEKYIDVELESGKSILHVYELQYLDADKARDVLRKVIDAAKGAGTGQAKTTATMHGGTQRTFGEVLIESDKSTDEKTKYFGGNKLIVAARHDDWRIVKELIEKLDQPQPQVLMEVIIADLTFEDIKALGASIRNLDKVPIPSDVNYQSAHVPIGQGIVLDPSNASPQTIKADLLNKSFTQNSVAVSQAAFSPAGSTVFSFNDNNGKTWGFAEILKSINKSKILSAPHVLAINGQEALVELGESRLLPDESVGTSGSTTIKTKWVPAKLVVKLTPRISSEAESVNMQVDIGIEQYRGKNTSERISRKIVTNANVKNKDVLAIGGLIRTDTDDGITKTPFLGDVPILGWFFKGHRKKIDKTNLTVFISPIIIEPHLRRGMSTNTQNSVKLMKAFAREGQLFDYLKEPITRWFFKTDLDNTEAIINNFTQKHETATPLAQKNQEKSFEKTTQASNKASDMTPNTVQVAQADQPPKAEHIKALVKDEENPLLRFQNR